MAIASGNHPIHLTPVIPAQAGTLMRQSQCPSTQQKIKMAIAKGNHPLSFNPQSLDRG